jgi:hypothetical protein
MRKTFLVLFLVCLTATLALAQAPPPASVCEIHINKVKPGMGAQYEAGRAKHMAWHKAQKDAWSWDVWEYTTGSDTGNFLVAACGHDWKDFDTRDKFNVADGADATATMGAHLAGTTMAYYVHRSDLTVAHKMGGKPPAYLSVLHFFLKPEGVLDFAEGVKKINAAIDKTNTPRTVQDWYSLANGGHGPELVLVQERNNIGEMAGTSAKTLDAIMQEAYGAEGAAIMATLRKSYYSSTSELLHFRSDLSYMAPAAK